MFYETLTALCEEKKITITSLVKTLGLSSSNTTAWKKNNPSVSSLLKLSKFFNVSIDYLLGLSDLCLMPHKNYSSINGNKNIVQQGNIGNSPIVIDNISLSENEQEFIRIYRKLSAKDKNKLMTIVFSYDNN